MITGLFLLVALGVLGWGFWRARPYGKLGILAWLQSVVLMAPWLIFFGLFAVGIDLNLVAVLFLFVASVGLYIFLGSRLRSLGANEALARKFSTAAEAHRSAASTTEDAETTTGSEPDATASGPSQTTSETVPELLPIPAEDLQAIKGIFGIDTFFATETIPYQNGAIFKGNLRGEVEESHARLSEILAERLGDRYRLYLIEGPDGKPVVVVLPSANDPQPTTGVQLILAGVLAIATVVTCMEAIGFLLGFDLLSDFSRFRETLPLSFCILAVLAAHELGHRFAAQQHNVKLSVPFFLPTWQIGAFGALTRFESVLPNRSVLFDVAFAGPAAGGIVSFVMLLTGLLLSHEGSYFQLPAEFFQGSILVGALSRVVLGAALQQPVVDVNPLVVIGWIGLLITAINVLPAGQLDGGRIVQSIYGRKIAGRTTIGSLVLLGLAALVNPLALYWAVLILFLQRDLERPALNELSEPNDARAALGLLALFLMAATLLPLTPSLAGRLGIGG